MARPGRAVSRDPVQKRERKPNEREKRTIGREGLESYERTARPEMSWWVGDKVDAFQRVMRVAKMLHAAHHNRRSKLREFERLYTARQSLPMSRGPGDRLSRKLTLNGVRACVDTSCNRLGKSKPKPQFLTVDGDWTAQEKAKSLTAYLEGLFDEIKIYDREELSFRDCCIFDIGTLFFGHEMRTIGGVRRKRLRCERVMPDELLVNDPEGFYGAPRQVVRKYFIDRAKLMAMFKRGGLYFESVNAEERDEILSKIRTAPQASIDVTERLVEGHSMIEVIEAWHLPSMAVDDGEEDEAQGEEPDDDAEPDTDRAEMDGKHALVMDGHTLLYEPWTKDYLPFVHMYWSRPIAGFFGSGLAEELAPIQYELNEGLKRVQIAQRHACAPKILCPTGAKIAKGKIGNDLRVEIVNYDGPTPPSFVTPNAMPAEVYQWISTLWQKFFEVTGVSQMSATSHKDPGLNSGVALREKEDIDSERFVIVGQRREQFFMDAAKMLIDMSRDLAEEDPDLAVTGSAGKMVRRIKWADVDLAEEQYTMRVYPVSLLPSTPAGKLQKVSELMENGLIDREQGLQLLDFPDVEKFTGLETAALEDAQMVVDSMVNGGEYIPPEPFMNLALSKRLCVSTYLRARTRKVGEKNLDKLRQFIGECDRLMEAAAPPPAAGPGGPPGMPAPAPGAMPPPGPMAAPPPGPMPIPMPQRAA